MYMHKKKTTLFIVFFIFLLLLSGCVPMERIVIDGEASKRIANHVVVSAKDLEASLRGNSTSNLRNGGYVLVDDPNIYYVNRLTFEDGSYVSYLQSLGISQIGIDYLWDVVIAPLDGKLAGIRDGNVYFIDEANDSLVSMLDLNTTETTALDTVRADALHLLDGVLYYSEAATGDLWMLPIDGAGYKELVAAGVGRLIGMSGGCLYAFDHTTGDKAIVRISLAQRDERKRLEDGPYADAEVSGEWLFFRRDGYVWRQPLEGSVPMQACVLPMDEYVLCDNYMAGVSTAGGIYIGRSDGTSITQISHDKASGISLIGDRLFYRNGNDHDAIYVIDLSSGSRTSLQGDTLTDGGVLFSAITDARHDEIALRFASTVAEFQKHTSLYDEYVGSLKGDILFADTGYGGAPLTFHQLSADAPVQPEKVGALVVITYQPTLLGYYTDGGGAYRIDTTLTLFEPNTPGPYLSWVVEGKPPTQIKHGAGDRTGIPRSWHQKALDLIAAIRK
jgi:outer membrane protein assembly factor BamB